MDINQISNFVVLLGAAQIALRTLTELCFFLAHALGKVPHRWAKWAGVASWWAGRGLSVLGGGTSNRYLAKRFVPRQPKDSSSLTDRNQNETIQSSKGDNP